MAREESYDRRAVAPLVEHVGAQDQIEGSEWRWLAPVADHQLERIRRPAAVLQARGDQLHRTRLPVHERDVGTAAGSCEAAWAQSATQIQRAQAMERWARQDMRDKRFGGGPDRAEVRHALVTALELLLGHPIEQPVGIVGDPEAKGSSLPDVTPLPNPPPQGGRG